MKNVKKASKNDAVDWSAVEQWIDVDESVKPITWAKGGESHARKQLEKFATAKGIAVSSFILQSQLLTLFLRRMSVAMILSLSLKVVCRRIITMVNWRRIARR